MNQVQMCFNAAGQSVACVVIPSPTLGRRREVFETINNGLPGLADDFSIEPDGNGRVAVSISINPLAERDTLNRMLVIRWAVQRLAEFAPTIGFADLREVQHRLLH